MLDQLVSFFIKVPFMVWVIVPALILAVITYLISRNKYYALYAGLIGMLATLFTTLFHRWEMYLTNHFVGSFDESGLPTDFTRSGFALLLDAWPIWLMPSIFITIILIAGHIWFKHHEKTQQSAPEATPDTKDVPTTRDLVMDKLEIQKLKHKVAVSEEKFRQAKDESGTSTRSKSADRNVEELRSTRLELGRTKAETDLLRKQIETQEEDLERANSLIDRLLNEKFGGEEPPK